MADLEPARPDGVLSLQRSDDGKVAGVCAALAEHWRVDPTLVRVVAIVLALSGGIGAVLYAGGWLWMRSPDGSAPMVAKLWPAAASWSRDRVLVTVAIASIIAMIATAGLSPFGPGPVFVVAAVVLLAHWQRRRLQSQAEDSEPIETSAPITPQMVAEPIDPSTDFGRAVLAWQQRIGALERGLVEPAATASAPAMSNPYAAAREVAAPEAAITSASPAKASPDSTRPTRKASWVAGLVTVVLAMATWLLVDLAVGGAPTLVLASATLGTVALCVSVSALLRRRARFGVLLGVALSCVVLLGLTPLVPGAPVEHQKWTTAASVPTSIQVTGQSVTIDGNDIALNQDHTVEMTVRGGTVSIELPENVAWTVQYTMRGGTLTTPDDQVAVGWNQGDMHGGPAGAPRLVVRLTVDGGVVVIE